MSLRSRTQKLVPSIFNTLFYVIVGTLGGLVITGMAAFVLSRKNFMLKNIIMKLIMFTMFFSGGIIPLFFVVRQIGIYDTRWAFLLPWIMSAYNMIIMRTFFLGIPESLEESATLDGATDLQIFFKIYVPLSTAVIAVIAMYYGVAWWNSWYQSLVFAAQQLAVAPADDTARGADHQHQVRNDRRYLDGRGIVHPRAG